MLLKVNNHDTATPVTAKPNFDCEGAWVLAFLYDEKTGVYKGLVNAIDPYQSKAKVSFVVNNNSPGNIYFVKTFTIKLYDSQTETYIDYDSVFIEDTVPASTQNYTTTVDFDIKDNPIGLFKVEENEGFSVGGTDLIVDSFTIVNPVYSTADGVVVAGPKGQAFDVYCNFTKYKKGLYNLVLVTTQDEDLSESTGNGFQGSGVIGKSKVLLTGKDGYSY